MPRPLRWIGIPLAGVLITGFFLFLGFPYELLAGRIARASGEALGARVEIRDLRPWLHWGLGVQAFDVRARLDRGRGRVLDFERVAARPSWSLSWLRLQPALYAVAEGPLGAARGVLVVTGGPSWDGELHDVDLRQLPLDGAWPDTALRGLMDAEVDLVAAAEGPEGSIRLASRDGSIQLPGLPLAIPFETATGDLVFGGEAWMQIVSFQLDGPLVSANLEGRVGHAAQLANAPLDIDLELRPEAGLRPALSSLGVRVDSEGVARMRIEGTTGAPQVR